MKNTGFKNKYAPLKSHTTLSSKVGFKKTKSIIRKKKELTPRQTLDSIVSKVVRLGSADENGMVHCATCPTVLHWTEMQCGHFQKRANTATRYQIKNLAPQCEMCNCFNDGEEEKFAEFIDSYYGPGTADQLRQEAQTVMPDYPYEQEIAKWQEILNHYSQVNKIIEI